MYQLLRLDSVEWGMILNGIIRGQTDGIIQSLPCTNWVKALKGCEFGHRWSRATQPAELLQWVRPALQRGTAMPLTTGVTKWSQNGAGLQFSFVPKFVFIAPLCLSPLIGHWYRLSAIGGYSLNSYLHVYQHGGRASCRVCSYSSHT